MYLSECKLILKKFQAHTLAANMGMLANESNDIMMKYYIF